MSAASKRPPSTHSSGEHPIVIAFREKMDSIQDNTIPDAAELAARIERLKEKSDRPPIDRRDGDSDPPVDIVDLPEELKKCLPKR
jgi:hypothetical protein